MFAFNQPALVLVLALLSASATAQSTDDACIDDCTVAAADAAGCNASDVSCVCLSQTFAQLAKDCVATYCTAAEIQEATADYDEACAAYLSTTNGNTSPTGGLVSSLSSDPASATHAVSTKAAATTTGSSSKPTLVVSGASRLTGFGAFGAVVVGAVGWLAL